MKKVITDEGKPCKLCGKTEKLLRKSHIIPRFMYDPLMGENNSMDFFNSSFPDKIKPVQTGIFDRHILCQQCDSVIFGQLESYAKVVLYGGQLKAAPNFQKAVGSDGIKSIICKSYDLI